MRLATTFAIGMLLCTAVVPAQPTTIIAAKPNETGPATSGQRPQPTPRPRPTPHPRPPTITVTNINDSGLGSLRQALADARDGYTIIFAITGSIGLTSGELLVEKNVSDLRARRRHAGC